MKHIPLFKTIFSQIVLEETTYLFILTGFLKQKKIIKHILFYILVFTHIANSWSNNYYFFQNIKMDADFTFSAVKTICEDENGLIWFGSDNGLYYHNTIRVKKVHLFEQDLGMSQSIPIHKIYKDKNHDLWVCSEKGLFKYIKTSNHFEFRNLIFKGDKTDDNQIVKNIVQIEKETYLIHLNNSVYKYNSTNGSLSQLAQNITGQITHINKDKNDMLFLGTKDGRIYTSQDNLKTTSLLHESSKNEVTTVCKVGSKYYIGYAFGGIEIVNRNGSILSELNSSQKGRNYLKSDIVRQIIMRKNGEIWVATHLGIIVLRQDTQALIDTSSETGLPHRSIYSLYIGRNENMWVGTFEGGLAYHSEFQYIFQYVPINYERKLFFKSTVLSFSEDSNEDIWIGNENEGGLKLYRPKTNDFINTIDIKTKFIKSVTVTENNIVAIGTLFEKQLLLYDIENKLKEIVKLPLKYRSGVLYSKWFENKLWMSDRTKLFSYDTNTKEINQVFPLVKNNKILIWSFYFDSSHNLWISTNKGLYTKHKESDRIYKCFSDKTLFDLEDEHIYGVCEDNDGRIWVATKGRGLFIYSPENKSIRVAPGYKIAYGADVYNLITDKQGDIWYNTNHGLYHYNASKQFTDSFNDMDGLKIANVRPNAMFCSKSGQIYLGSINGFSIVNPNIIRKNLNAPLVLMSDVLINNKKLSNENTIATNSENFSQLKKITLDSRYNTLGFKAVSTNYIKSEKNKFRYRLINYDENWVEVGQNSHIFYRKVPPGKYILEVYGSNNDNIWSDTPYRLELTILAPFYKRWYLIIFYIVVVLVVTYILYRELKTKLRLKKEIAEERANSETKDFIYSERLKFFTNISHELRTPVSLIISPLKSLLNKSYNDEATVNLLKVVERNAKRLLKITDQTLDFRLLEVGKLEPIFEKHELIQLAKEVNLCFEQQLIHKQINFTFTSEFQKLEIIIDGDMIEKILYNLISNALKYTSENGNVVLDIRKTILLEEAYVNYIFTGKKFTGKAIQIEIRDTGKGIKSKLISHVFNRFTKGNESHTVSSGIGLHLCKEYSEMNDGNIFLSSNEGIGSTFILNLPLKDDDSYKRNKIEQIFKQTNVGNESIPMDKLYKNDNTNKHTVLITEDNDELRNYLKLFLSQHFKVVTAKSGEQGLEILKDIIPDILITDVSMPGINGIELIKIIKEDSRKKQIAIIVMTGHRERKYQMQSILCGADAFLTKPIEEGLLLAQVNNILEKQKIKPAQSKESKETSEADNFISNVEKIVVDNFHNTQFEISTLITKLGISKTTLARKLKLETELNPSTFIRNVRLKQAIKLMRNHLFNIDEIATFVGFNSTSYFIKTFKIKYGITPKEYQNELHKKDNNN